MLTVIDKVISSEQLAGVGKALAQAEFVNGRLTAGKAARAVKNNLEIKRESEIRTKLITALMGAVSANEKFKAAAMPARISTPIISCYLPGMYYGAHVDDPVMGGRHKYRSDVSFTLFLNEPEEYEGGELAILTGFGRQKIKLAAGSMVVYPASGMHEVLPITSGKRLVMLSWLQSMVRDPAKRAILYDLWQAKEQLSAQDSSRFAGEKLALSYGNLIRMWAVTV